MEQRRKRIPIGIDLGTAYARAAVFNGTQWKMIPDDYGEPAMPSYVAFTDSGVLVGQSARMQARQNPTNTIFDVIRLIGRRYSDPSVQKDMRLWPFKVRAGTDDKLLVDVYCKGKLSQFSPVDICSMILIKIKENAEKNLGTRITGTVMTVPVYFNYEQRQAIKQAGEIAGLNILQIVSAPAASALFYGKMRRGRSNMVIFDLGAGTLDVAAVTIKDNICKVVATAGDIHLGGSDFDNNLVDHFVNLVKKKEKEDISSIPLAISNLRTLCEKAKIFLSSGTCIAPVKIAPLFNDVDFDSSITEAKFHVLNKDLFSKCINTIAKCLKDAKMGIAAVDVVILAGGSTRIPLLQSSIHNFFDGKEITVSQNLEEATAFGAAIQAFFRSTVNGTVESWSLLDVTPFSLGLESLQGEMTVYVPKNTSIPTKIKRTLHRREASKTNFCFEVYEGEGRLTCQNNFLGKFELFKTHIFPTEIGVCFEIHEDGNLIVTAEDIRGGIRDGIIITCKNIEDSRKMVREALLYKESEKSILKASTTKSWTRSGTSSMQEQMRAKRTLGKLLKKYAEPEECAIGIDFGTTNSCVAVWQRNGVKIIENEYNSRATYSCVTFTDTGRMIGDAVHKEQVITNPGNTVPNIKRLIGRCYSDWSAQNDGNFLPFEILCNDKNRPMVSVQFKNEKKFFNPEEIAAMVLLNMKDIAEAHLKSKISSAVISVPACFTSSQRKAIKDAAAIAGLNVMQLLDEPKATAIAYFLQKVGAQNSKEKILLIFDLGGGNLDVSIVTIKEGTISVKAVAGDANLGGEDFDNNMAYHFLEKFMKGKKRDISNKRRCLRRLKAACEKAKKVLSHFVKTTIEIDSLDDGIDFRTIVTRALFEELNMSLFKKCIGCVERCLAEAKIDKSCIDEVILVGGSSRIPMVHQLLKDFFGGKELCDSMNLDETVAYGAAVQAATLSDFKDMKQLCGLKVEDVTSSSLWLEGMGGAMSLLVPKCTPIPMKKELLFSAYSDDQMSMSIGIRNKIGSRAVFTLSNAPPNPMGNSELAVSFEIDNNGILNLTAESNKIIVSRENGDLTKEEIQEMIEAAARYKAEDEEDKARAAGLNSLERLAYKMKSIVRDPGVSASRKKSVAAAADNAIAWLEKNYDAPIDDISAQERHLETIIGHIVYLGTNAS